jgi:pimeloyl-ACP methyl ester carboxylesterase
MDDYLPGLLNGKLLVIDRCGQVPYLEKPAQFDNAVLRFLR